MKIKKIQIELTEDHGLRGVTVWFSDGSNWQGLPKDKDGLCATTFGKIQTVRLVSDFLKLLEKGKNDDKKNHENE
jgi:hypothetical protein